jgi:RHS repeat-associated protein
VDVANGDVILAATDVMLPGVLPLVLERTHRSSWRTGRWFGRSWLSSFDQRLLVTADRVIGAFADGRILTWLYPDGSGDEPLLPVTGGAWPLRRNRDGSYAVTDPQRGLTWRFERRAGYDNGPGGQGELPLVSLSDRIGHEIVFHYDVTGQPSSVVHSGGYRIRVTMTGGHVTALTLTGRDGHADVPLLTCEYDADGNLSGVINSSGLPLRYSYDPAGRLTGWLDRNAHYYRYTYDSQGRCIRGEGPGGALSGTFTYEPGITRWTDAAGAVTTYEITPSAHVAATTDPLGNVTRWDHDARGNVTTRVDPLGRVTRYAYDDRGNLIAITRPDGSQSIAEYDERCQPVLLTEPDGTQWRQEYDSRGNRTALIAPDATVTAFSYDDRGHLARVTDPDGVVTVVACDAVGQPVEVTDPDGSVTRYERDLFGRATRITAPDGGVTRLGWTTEGKLTSRVHPDGATEEWDWDPEGNLARHVDAAGAVTGYEYGAFDKVTARRWVDGTRTEFRYDHQSRLTEVVHAGLTWRYAYDPAGRLVAETDYNGANTTYAYDPAGQVSSQVNAVGQETTYGYDVLGNLTESSADGNVTTYGYDPLGRLVRTRNTHAEIRVDRDALGRVIAETCNGATVATRYDAVGRVTSLRTPSGAVTTWNYDRSGRPVTMDVGGHELGFGYDDAGREIRRDLPGGLTLTQDWDQRGRLTLQALTRRGGEQVLQRRAYGYRPDGLLTAIDDLLGGTRGIGLNDAGRVVAVNGPHWSERYTYDQAGNLSAASWPAASAFEAQTQGRHEVSGTLVARAGNIRYRHDRQGRVVQRQRTRISRKPDTWRYEWDASDRLTFVTTPDGSQWRYQYDPLGRRIAKEHVSPDGTVAERTTFTWNGPSLVEQITTSGVTTWTYQPGTFTPLTQASHAPLRDAPQDQVDERFYAIITDIVGTPTELAGPDGTLAGRQVQTVWGGGTTWTSGGAQTPLRFPGQYQDPETGLHYNYQRYYDPVSGSYLTPDPLGLAPSPNPHTYVRNPQAEIDPLGLQGCNVAQVAARHGGQPVDQGYKFPTRRAARQAASEIAGDLGSRPRAIRASDFRGGPYWMKGSSMVIGRESFDGSSGWRDDFLGHTFGDGVTMGPHVNIWGPGINDGIHLFY